MPTILIVDSHDDTRDMNADWLRHHGFAVVTADNTDDAERLAADADVVVTGVLVKGTFDGLGLVARLRDRARPRQKIIVLTSSLFPDDIGAARSAGCDIFLRKPCDPQTLLDTVREFSGQPGRGWFMAHVGRIRSISAAGVSTGAAVATWAALAVSLYRNR